MIMSFLLSDRSRPLVWVGIRPATAGLREKSNVCVTISTTCTISAFLLLKMVLPRLARNVHGITACAVVASADVCKRDLAVCHAGTH